jgi:hypothetical protein
MTFVIAAILTTLGYGAVAGHMPGAAQASTGGMVLAFFLVWGAVDAAASGLKRKASR